MTQSRMTARPKSGRWNTLRLDEPAHRNVALLAGAQAMANTANSIIMVVTALVGYSLAIDKSLATLPLGIHFLAMMATSAPASLLMGKIGRRPGLIIGSFLGILGGSLQFLAVMRADFAMMCIGAAPLGAFAAFAQHYRFAAADIASVEFKPKAISLSLAGGIVGAFLGPELAKIGRGMFDPILYAGCYLFIAVMALLTIAVIAFVQIPLPQKEDREGPVRPLSTIIQQPNAIGAIVTSAVGFSMMVLLMTSTPLAMNHDGHSFDDSAFVIQWHALAMYAPSFFTGSLIGRFGVRKIIFAGILFNVASLAFGVLGSGVTSYWLALFALGLGWNFMFVGGSSLLTRCHTDLERPKVQAINDFIVFSSVTVASFSSGALFSWIGWSAVNLAMIPALLIATLAVFMTYRRAPVTQAS